MVQHTAPTNVGGFTELLIWANTFSKGWFVVMALISLYFISFLQLKKVTNNRVALTSTSFFVGVVATFFWVLNVFTFNHMIVIIAILGLIMATAKWTDKGY